MKLFCDWKCGLVIRNLLQLTHHHGMNFKISFKNLLCVMPIENRFECQTFWWILSEAKNVTVLDRFIDWVKKWFIIKVFTLISDKTVVTTELVSKEWFCVKNVQATSISLFSKESQHRSWHPLQTEISLFSDFIMVHKASFPISFRLHTTKKSPSITSCDSEIAINFDFAFWKNLENVKK